MLSRFTQKDFELLQAQMVKGRREADSKLGFTGMTLEKNRVVRYIICESKVKLSKITKGSQNCKDNQALAFLQFNSLCPRPRKNEILKTRFFCGLGRRLQFNGSRFYQYCSKK